MILWNQNIYVSCQYQLAVSRSGLYSDMYASPLRLLRGTDSKLIFKANYFFG